MDTHLQVSLLQKHSEQLRKLTTGLSKDLRQLRLALREQEESFDTQELHLLVELAEFNYSLFHATDLFSQRLHALLEKGKGGNRAPE
jgi:hypothetical protein